jgi:peptidyl-prolyl cis-trans isomerase A (cyclophilin A)
MRPLFLLAIAAACAFAQATPPAGSTQTPALDLKPGLYAVFNTSMGTITAELFEKDAPITIANFVALARGTKSWKDPNSGAMVAKPLYNNITFHRVIPNFMIQGGDPTGTGMGGPGYRFQDETKGSPHSFDKPGKLAMANSGPNTNGCQFFITVAPTSWLTGRHTIFGEVVEGQDVADKISTVARNAQDKPHKDVVLESVAIERVA